MRPSRIPLRPVIGLVALGAIAVVLVGCTPTTAPSHSPSRTRTPTATASPDGTGSPSASPSASATVSSGASPVSIPCTTAVSNQTVYDFNPIYSAKSPVSPASGSAAAQVRADRGTVCEWVNTSSGATIDVAIGKYSSAGLSGIRSRFFTGGAATSEYGGDAGYFATAGGAGTASALVGPYWVSASGQEFLAPTDADPFMRSAVAAAQSAG